MPDDFQNYYEDDVMNYVPPTPIDDPNGKTLVNIKENPIVQQHMSNQNIQVPNNSMVENVRDDEDVFKGKFYTNTSNGVNVQAIRTVKIKNNYFVIFNTGEQIPVNELNRLYIESSGQFDDTIKPNNYYNNNLNTIPEKRVIVESNPVKIILEKLKEKTDILTIDLELKLPPQEIYNVLVENYENAEDDIINYIFGGDTIENVKNAVKLKLNDYYGK